MLTTDSALETTFPATLPATLLAVLTTEPALETTFPATLQADFDAILIKTKEFYTAIVSNYLDLPELNTYLTDAVIPSLKIKLSQL